MQALVLPYDGHAPQLGEEVFLAPGAKLIGQATLGDRVSVWYNAVVRADVHWIRIGADSNIQDGAVLHGQSTQVPAAPQEGVIVVENARLHPVSDEHPEVIENGWIIFEDHQNWIIREDRTEPGFVNFNPGNSNFTFKETVTLFKKR